MTKYKVKNVIRTKTRSNYITINNLEQKLPMLYNSTKKKKKFFNFSLVSKIQYTYIPTIFIERYKLVYNVCCILYV